MTMTHTPDQPGSETVLVLRERLAEEYKYAGKGYSEVERRIAAYEYAITALQAGSAPGEAQLEACDCPGIGKPDPMLHAPNCPARDIPDKAKTPLLALLQKLDDVESVKQGSPAWQIAVAKATAYLRDNAHQVRLSIRGHLGIGLTTPPSGSVASVAGDWNAAIEAAAQEAEHWQERSTPHHECGRYIAGAIRARFIRPAAMSAAAGEGEG